MLRRWYLVGKTRRRWTRGALLILLALLTIFCVLAVGEKQVSARKQTVIPPSFVISQSDQVAARASQLDNQGQELYEAGEFTEAIKLWQQAEKAYVQADDADGVAKNRINMAEALQALGLHPRACDTLLQAFNIAELDCQNVVQSNENYQQLQNSLLNNFKKLPNSQIKVIGLRSFGNVLRKLDNLELSQQVLQLSLNAAKALRLPEDESAAKLSIGNTFQALGDRTRASLDTQSNIASTPWRCLYSPSLGQPRQFYQQAADYYQQAATEPISTSIWVQAQINRLNVLLETNALSEAQGLWPQIKSKLDTIPASRAAAYLQLKLASGLTCLKQANVADSPSWTEIAQTFATTARLAHRFSDQRTESYATGFLGGLYAQVQTPQNAQNLDYAQNLTQQALTLAQAIKATDITYLWQWQLGYLKRIQGDNEGAISAYTQAVDSLHSIRSDLSAASRNIQFSFTERVEPVYRQLVDLLLQSDGATQKNLKQARDVVEALQVAELENLLRCNLQIVSPVPIERGADPTAAVIYPIILDDRIEVIFSLSDQPLRHYSTPLSKEQNFEYLLEALRQSLELSDSEWPQFLKFSQQVYNLLIKPVESELEKNGVKTLVFVLDGALRQIPMAALHSGEHYLIEKYALAVSPSLQLLPPKSLPNNQLQVLAAGISQKIPGFNGSALPEVKDELKQISEVAESVILSNQEFTGHALESEINERPFSVVHLATHGQFSSSPDQTYIRAWDKRININELKTLLQNRAESQPDAIDLLVLSACETAEGDKRAALGLAGVAVRVGVRTTLATLWEVNDTSTAELMGQFYKTLSNQDNSTVSKAKALQNAQLKLLRKYKYPASWASYVLVGNWL
ncbi:MAG: CHAT domain-containing protein [Gloeocapsa sp. UFS-A4-WI-NPMV-4B04]|jgi:CHAT domain-containing protein|nr:CHAT domain-containing protein [Gloeocapsa sp. UFS-A4-WI-NPMV-4B04]